VAKEGVSPETHQKVSDTIDRLRSVCWTSLKQAKSNSTVGRELESALDSLAQSNQSSGSLEVYLFLTRRKMEAVDHLERDHRAAWDYLEKASASVGISPSSTPPEVNFKAPISHRILRALTSAYYNVGAILHNDSLPELAKRFFERAVYIASEAIRLSDAGEDKTDDDVKELEHVRQQLHRRCELLAITYYSVGDRRGAYNAYGQAIAHSPDGTGIKRLVEKYTKIGAMDLLRSGSENSLAVHLRKKGWDSKRIATVVEMQILGLEGSIGKESVVAHIRELIREALYLWEGQKWPLRRARCVSSQLTDLLMANLNITQNARTSDGAHCHGGVHRQRKCGG
jgi:tetratricopeptide (TPR) repeat protein